MTERVKPLCIINIGSCHRVYSFDNQTGNFWDCYLVVNKVFNKYSVVNAVAPIVEIVWASIVLLVE